MVADERPASRGPAAKPVTRHAALLGVILVVALALRVPGLGESLWYDEMWSTRVKLGSPELVVQTIASDVHPPFYTIVMSLWVALFGDSEISVRLLPLASGLLTVVLAARLAQVYGGRAAGAVTATVLALSPVHIWYSQEARPYSLLLLLLLACVWSVHRIRETGATRWYLAYAVLALCFVLTHYYALAYIGVLTLLAMRDPPRMRARMVAIAASVAAALALFLAAKARLWGLETEVGSSRTFELRDLWRLPFEWFLTGGVFGAPDARHGVAAAAILAGQVATLGLVVLGLTHAGRPGGRDPGGDPGRVAERRARLRRVELASLLLVLPLAFLVLGAVGRRGYYIERSALTALPFFAMTVGVGVATLRPPPLRVLAQAFVVVAGAIVLATYYAKRDAWTVYKPNPDWRTVGRALLAEHARTGAPVVVVSMSPALELTYYASLELTRYPARGEAGGVAQGGRAARHPAGDTVARGGLRERARDLLRAASDSTSPRNGRVYVLARPDVGLVREIAHRERVDAVYLAHNEYWLGSDPPNYVIDASNHLIGALASDTSFVVRPAARAKGLRLLRVEPSGAHGAR